LVNDFSGYFCYRYGMPARIAPRKPVKIFLREWREHLGLTQDRLGDRIGADGVDKGTISRWESADRIPTSDVMAAYAEALGIPVTYLYRMPATGHSLDELAADLSPQDIQKIVRAIEKLKRAS
jgi:transcriptional regulator with XRE-family HTH domain